MLHLRLDQVRETARMVVNDNPEYVYRDTHTQCVYAEWNDAVLAPSCLVGHVLYRLGIPLDSMVDCIGEAVMLLDDLQADGLVDESPDTAAVSTYLLIAQERQDKERVQWWDALSRAEEWAVQEFGE